MSTIRIMDRMMAELSGEDWARLTEAGMTVATDPAILKLVQKKAMGCVPLDKTGFREVRWNIGNDIYSDTDRWAVKIVAEYATGGDGRSYIGHSASNDQEQASDEIIASILNQIDAD